MEEHINNGDSREFNRYPYKKQEDVFLIEAIQRYYNLLFLIQHSLDIKHKYYQLGRGKKAK